MDEGASSSTARGQKRTRKPNSDIRKEQNRIASKAYSARSPPSPLLLFRPYPFLALDRIAEVIQERREGSGSPF